MPRFAAVHRVSSCLWGFYLGAAIAPLWAQSEGPVFEARGPRREVVEGRRFEVSFVLRNETALRFIPPDFGGLKVRSGPAEVRSAGFFNGKAYSQQAWVYEIEAPAAGTYTIGPAVAQTARQNLRSQPFLVRVVPPTLNRSRKESPAPAYFIAADVFPEHPWVGQQILYRLRLYTRVSVSEVDLLELPSFEGFYSTERRRFDARTQYEKIYGKRYAVRTLYEAALFAQRPDTLIIGSARVRLLLDERGSGLFGTPSAVIAADSVAIAIRPLPTPLPKHFCGGVGRYTWSVAADKQTLTTDDVLSLTVRIRGNGDARRFTPPTLALPQGWEALAPEIREQNEYETGDEFIHEATLVYAALPKQAGNYTLTPAIAFFEPDSGRYQRLQVEKPLEVAVTPGRQEALPAEALEPTRPVLPPSSIWERLWLQLQEWAPAVAALIAVLALGWLFALWRQQRRHRAVSVADSPAPTWPSREQLEARLRDLGRQSSQLPAREFYRQLLRWIEQAVAAALRIAPTQLSRGEALQALADRGLSSAALDDLSAAWEACERAVYAQIVDPTHLRPCWEKTQLAWKSLSKLGRGSTPTRTDRAT